jgi:hypothetical protein
MDWIQGVFQYIEKAWQWLFCFFSNLWCQGADFIMDMLEEIMTVLMSALSVIPIPDALANFQWPEAGPLGAVIIDVGIPQALSILAGAFMVRFLKGLIPLIRN